ncbi:SDR family oxidoreductase [Emticicia sp. TH156]|uniref:SDR family oxidoreductase n=1 Tax=Emticicia sp. TH156 TaxID=2067454 RepID=UPI000C7747F8|nr:SDR family oxidoreductase [Emticicia sp. TH156]PLK46205.1 short chain dehydrogenase [Emticicia sp. TH156]
MKRFSNKVVWITGASSGIGEATAYEFAKEGARLVLSARRLDELLRVKQNTGLPYADVLVLPIDVERQDEFPEKVQAVIRHFGRIDVLFNNAGISQRSSVAESSMEVYRKIMDINFFGVVALTKAVLPVMVEQKSGHIAVTSSISGKLGTPMRSGYCATKHALHGFFDSLRAEVWKEKINVTIICPGYIHTDISINAIAGDGGKHGKMDKNQETGISPEACASEIVNAIAKGKEEVYIGRKEVMGVYLKRFFPGILSKIVRNQMPK